MLVTVNIPFFLSVWPCLYVSVTTNLAIVLQNQKVHSPTKNYLIYFSELFNPSIRCKCELSRNLGVIFFLFQSLVYFVPVHLLIRIPFRHEYHGMHSWFSSVLLNYSVVNIEYRCIEDTKFGLLVRSVCRLEKEEKLCFPVWSNILVLTLHLSSIMRRK